MDTPVEHILADTVEANTLRVARIEIVDDDAKVRMKLYISQDGTPVITLMDANRADRLMVTLSDNSSGWIAMRSPDGGNQFNITIDDAGEPTVFFYDSNHTIRMASYVDSGAPCVIMYDSSEVERFAMFLELDGKPYIMFRNKDEQSQTKVTVADDGSECFILEDREGEEIRIPLRAPREL